MIDLAPELIAFLLAAAVAAGFIDAIAGGGGLITLPALLAAGVNPVSALGTNKVQSSFGTAMATWSYWKAGRINFTLLRWPLVATFAGAGLGTSAVMVIDSSWLMIVLPGLLIAIAMYFLFGPKASDEDAQARMTPVTYSLIAGAIGFYDGFFGPGTGSFFALSLVTLMGMGLTRATAHTKALNLASNAVSVAVFALGGQVLWALGLTMAAGQVLGGWLGSKAAMRFGPRLIRPLLVIICLAMVARLLVDPENPLRIWLAALLG
ncbi:TSUP family transporter [Hyphomonas sp. WL0036]|uniref:TSUP family transporter n=1 Tax=Hyphomonas sediminis TaxID=2866160 RepID=UPI001C80C2F4|nr:TSUP family transporter [Hyphomonas sediminis]MBY9067716.1 TSUP family transporter [Hyphomonas sediminis]